MLGGQWEDKVFRLKPPDLDPWAIAALYGTTLFGGSNDYGTVYTITSDGTFTSLYSFTNGLDGAYPKAQLIQGVDGNFYGTTQDGGGEVGKKWCSEHGCGSVFMITRCALPAEP